jgi:hypothetical protein
MHIRPRLIPACLAAALAGCAALPEDIRGAGLRTDVDSANAPYAAINCMARKLEPKRTGMIAQIRQTGLQEQYEAAFRVLDDTVAVVDVAPAAGGAKGSVLTLWRSPGLLGWREAEFLETAKGC